MPTAPAGSILRHIHRFVETHAEQTLSDGELLQRFVVRREAAAFAALLRRHGRLVWGVCRHVLHHEHDAEDAFQATFLVLARRAASIRKPEAVVGWLHGVAYRIATRAQHMATRRQAREHRAAVPAALPPTEAAVRELQALLDAEVARLPAKFRAPFVLCCLESRTRAEAAAELGIHEGTMSSRIARARRLLQARLSRRGVALSAVLTACVLWSQSSSASVPPALVQPTLKAAGLISAGEGASSVVSQAVAALFESGAKLASGTKWKIAIAGLLAAIVAGGIGIAVGLQLDEIHQPAGQQQKATSKPPSADLQGDPLPAGAIARLGSVRFRHGSWVRDIALSPDGKIIAAVEFDKVRLWDSATGKERYCFPLNPAHEGESVAFAPDGRTLAITGFGKLLLLDARSGKVLHQVDSDRSFSVAFAPDGKTLAAAQFSGGVLLVDTATGKKICHVNGGRTWSVDYSSDGRLLAWGEGSQIHLREAPEHMEIDRRITHNSAIHAVAFSPNGKMLATSDDEHVLTLWDTESGKRLRTFEGHAAVATRLVFSPDGKFLASGSGDHVVGGGHELHSLRLWDVATGKELAKVGEHAEGVRALRFSRDGKVLITGGNMCLRLWDVATRKEILAGNGHQGWVGSVAYSPDGNTLASAGSDMTVRLWDLATGKERLVLTGAEATIDTVAISPDGSKVAGGSRDARVLVWDATTGKEIARLKAGEPGWEAHAAFSPDGKLLASASRDGQLVLWDAATFKEVRRFPHSERGFMSLAFSPDGKFLATGSIHDKRHPRDEEGADLVRLWDVSSGREVRRFLGAMALMAPTVDFSPAGRIVASGGWGRAIHLWDVARGKLRGIVGEQYKSTNHCAFSPDGRMLVTTGYDGTIRLWETATGLERRSLAGHVGSTSAAAFAPDGKTLASGGWDTTGLIWDLRGDAAKTDLTARDLESLWESLAGADSIRAYEAILTLTAVAGPSVRFFQDRLRPAKADRRIEQLLADLDSENFQVRTGATAQLKDLGESAESALRRVLAGDPSPEVRRRVEQLLNALQHLSPPPETLRAVRAVEVLEHIATPEARQLLHKLAEGTAEARLTREAKAALERLSNRLR
jgi:RNA polymerase sigma factor (sigma-70 family)